ncbi:ABC transporter substrate-binding protein [Pararhodobacter aggregans]|uniref:ABC transporter substrate-binding protein n=1 Tax=Pararhodobacter aggregans TaxID=404875 RepID=A0A2T7UQE7_9RHOB|nr:ABC transporter substrate-binding protein [Pararhodobacter aggregans]PTX01694.1 peptide/nickel transport system substrate-binding protein [Pararhodobacter aggregans]PVE46943.1 ABC transporter substrate-binding protein [Pararhodobacter aggregans]
MTKTPTSPTFAMSRRALLLASGAGLAAGILPFGPLKAQQSGTLAMCVTPEPNAMCAAFNTASPVTVVSGKMLEGLLNYDFNVSPTPALATAWEVAADGLSITFSLREGVMWHDGQPFTSADVQYTIMEILKQHHPRGRSTLASVTAVETPDDHTAILRLSQPAPALMYALAGWESPMLPKHVYEGTDVLQNPANNAPVGTGPFVFQTWERGSHIIMTANQNYWGEGEPKLERLVVRIITDPSARAAALDAGELHLAGDGPIPVNQVQRFMDSADFQVDTRGTEMNNSLDMIHTNLRNEHLAKLEVRQALMHAMNREAMLGVVYYGLAEMLTGPIPETLPNFYTADVPSYDYDPARANALLDAAGYARGADGMRFSLRLIAPTVGDTYERMGQFLKQNFRDVGVDLELISADIPTFIRSVFGEYDYDLTLYPGSVTADPTIGSQRFWWSKAASQGTPFVNSTGYESAEMDQILEDASVEPDPEARRALFVRFQQLAMTDLPILPVARPIYVTIAAANVVNFVPGPDGIRAPYGSLAFTG